MLKNAVKDYWNNEPCGTPWAAGTAKYSREYFERIEEHRYAVEPQIHAFAQFTRFHGNKVLEVGVGAGTDFLQWVRAGAKAHGVDLTPEGVNHVQKRLEAYGLEATELRTADAEALPYPDGTFDLVYSWGVIHHSPDTLAALREIIRVTKPKGRCKIMVYNRHSLGAFYLWVSHALLAGKPWLSFAHCLHHHQESPGTKGYTRGEIADILAGHPVENVRIAPVVTHADTLEFSRNPLFRAGGAVLEYLFRGSRFGWFLTFEFTKK